MFEYEVTGPDGKVFRARTLIEAEELKAEIESKTGTICVIVKVESTPLYGRDS